MDRREADDVRRLLRALGYAGVTLVPSDTDTLTAARRLITAARAAGSTQVPSVPSWPPPIVAVTLEAELKSRGWPDTYPDTWSNG